MQCSKCCTRPNIYGATYTTLNLHDAALLQISSMHLSRAWHFSRMKFANLFSVLNTLILFWSIQGFFYFSHHATGNLITQRDFNLTATIQQITNPDSATNVVGYIDSGFSDSANIRAIIGVGKRIFSLAECTSGYPFRIMRISRLWV